MVLRQRHGSRRATSTVRSNDFATTNSFCIYPTCVKRKLTNAYRPRPSPVTCKGKVTSRSKAYRRGYFQLKIYLKRLYLRLSFMTSPPIALCYLLRDAILESVDNIKLNNHTETQLWVCVLCWSNGIRITHKKRTPGLDQLFQNFFSMMCLECLVAASYVITGQYLWF